MKRPVHDADIVGTMFLCSVFPQHLVFLVFPLPPWFSSPNALHAHAWVLRVSGDGFGSFLGTIWYHIALI